MNDIELNMARSTHESLVQMAGRLVAIEMAIARLIETTPDRRALLDGLARDAGELISRHLPNMADDVAFHMAVKTSLRRMTIGSV